MTEGHYLAYQFMVSNFGGVSFASKDELALASVNGNATRRFIPSKTWGMYNLDSQEIMAEGYLCRYGFDLIKIANGQVSEYYRRLISNKSWSFIAYNLQTLEPIESYKNIGNQLCKFDLVNGNQLQANNNCTFQTLPKDFKSAIISFPYKNNVFMYAIKPYGRVVEFYYPKSK